LHVLWNVSQFICVLFMCMLHVKY